MSSLYTKNLGPSYTLSHGYVQIRYQNGKSFHYRYQEDPFEDMKALHLTHNDSMLVITSAGDNALHYAIGARPNRVNVISILLTNRVLTYLARSTAST